MYPQLIDNETFEKVRSKSRVNHYGKRSVKTIYLLRNKLKCGHCGMPISAESGTKRNGEKANYYKCIGIKKYHNGCNKETIRQDVLEEFVLNSIIEELSKPKNLNDIVKGLMEIQNDLTNKSSVNTYNNVISVSATNPNYSYPDGQRDRFSRCKHPSQVP